jgi:hypothetical protein
MHDPVTRLEDDRATRDAARDLFQNNLTAFRQGLKDKGVGARIAERASIQARELADETLAVASESKGIIALALAALVLWLARAPLIAWLSATLDDVEDETEFPETDSSRKTGHD